MKLPDAIRTRSQRAVTQRITPSEKFSKPKSKPAKQRPTKIHKPKAKPVPVPLVSQSSRYKTVQPNGTSRPHVLKTCKQLDTLAEEWSRSPEFDNVRIKALAAKLGITKRKVYKWVYD